MKNPLIWLVLALVLGGGLLWLGGDGTDLSDPLAMSELPETRAAEAEPANLAEPEEVLVETAVSDSSEPVVLDAELEASPLREAIAAHRPVEIAGRVVDVATGAGVGGCWVSLTSGRRLEAWREAAFFLTDDEDGDLGVLEQVETDEEGRFAIVVDHGALNGEAAVFLAAATGWAAVTERRDLLPQEIQSGADLLLKVKTWPPPVAGNISGVLRTETGSFPEGAIPRTDHILLDLVSDELPAIEMRAVLEPHKDDLGGVTFSFLFEDVPEGNYELTLSSLGNYRWAPTSLRVAPPASNIEFLRFDLDGAVPLIFEVTDAETGEPVADFEARHIKQTNSAEHGVLLHTGPIESEQFPRDQAFVWSVEADGYAVAYGDQGAFEERDGKRVARIRLNPGWSTRFLVMGGPDGTRPQPLAGAEIRIDGDVAGRTDENGGLVVVMDAEPSEIEVRYLDWKSAAGVSTSRRRSNVTPVILVEPSRD